VGEDLLDHRSFQDGAYDLERSGATARAVLHADVNDALEQAGTLHQLTCFKPAVRERQVMAVTGFTRGSP
jgi:hypothetical protein